MGCCQILYECNNNVNLKEEHEYKINKKSKKFNKIIEIKEEINYETIKKLPNKFNLNNKLYDHIIKEDKRKENYFNNFEFQENITNDSYTVFGLDNTFTSFISFDDISYLVYADDKKTIILYNLIDKCKLNEVKNAHKEYITNFRHFSNIKNKTDLIISISGYDNNIKLWTVHNMDCLLNMENINDKGYLYSASFLNDINNNQIYIISSNYFVNMSDKIKIFDLQGNKIKAINNSNAATYFIDSYYDNKLFKNYIITGNDGFAKSYDYRDNNLYHEYYDDNDEIKLPYISILINDKEKIIKLISSSIDGNIRIWNFHTGIFLKKIRVLNNQLNGIYLWNKKYLFVGCIDNIIRIVDIEKGEIIKNLAEHNEPVITVKNIIHKRYGKCLISQSLYNDQIKLWINKNEA